MIESYLLILLNVVIQTFWHVFQNGTENLAKLTYIQIISFCW